MSLVNLDEAPSSEKDVVGKGSVQERMAELRKRKQDRLMEKKEGQAAVGMALNELYLVLFALLAQCT